MIYRGHITDTEEVKSFLNKCYAIFKDKDIVIDVDLWKDKRTLQQNKYLWVLFELAGEEHGTNKYEAKHWILKTLHFTQIFTNRKTGEVDIVPKDTRNLSYDDFYKLTSDVLIFLQSYGIKAMTPQEYGI